MGLKIYPRGEVGRRGGREGGALPDSRRLQKDDSKDLHSGDPRRSRVGKLRVGGRPYYGTLKSARGRGRGRPIKLR